MSEVRGAYPNTLRAHKPVSCFLPFAYTDIDIDIYLYEGIYIIPQIAEMLPLLVLFVVEVGGVGWGGGGQLVRL